MKISQKLVLFFLSVGILPIVLEALLIQNSTEQIITINVSDHLESIASIQKTRIHSLIDETQERMKFLTDEYNIANHLASFIESNETTQDLRNITTIINSISSSIETITEVSTFNMLGKNIASTDSSKINSSALNEPFFNLGKEKSFLFDFFHEEDYSLVSRHSMPIINGSIVYGVLVITEVTNDFLTLVLDYSGLGESGETVIAKRDTNGDALFLTPLKFDENASLTRTISKSDLEIPMTQALLKEEKFFTKAIDYRSVPVLATTRYINTTDWGVVVKIDKKEAFAPIETLRYQLFISSLFLVGLILGLTYYFTYSITKPIAVLISSVNIIAQGNLNHKAEITSQDEIGELSKSFNLMTESLIESTVNLERIVEERTRELEQSNAELEQFAYIASHDLQEPLRTISRFLELLSLKYHDQIDLKASEFIDFAIEGAVRMQQQIEDLLEYSRVGTRGKSFEKTDLADVLEQALLNLQITIGEENATITYDKLPVLKIDSIQFLQLFQNLIGNSIKFRKDVPPLIHISSKTTSKSHMISITDNGIGIDKSYFARIFQIFQRLHTTKEYPGTGIGLAICKRIVERHNGRIWVESALEKGSTFYIELPKEEGDNFD